MHINVLLRGGGGFDPLLKKWSLCPPMYCSEGVAVLIPHEDKLKLRSCSVCWPEVVAVFILNEDKFKLRSYSIFWPEGVAVLIPHEDKFNLRSDSIYWPGEGSFDPLLQ